MPAIFTRIQQSACMLPRHASASLLTHLPLPPPCCVSLFFFPGVEVPTEVYSMLHAATFATLTNVNFDDERFKVRAQNGCKAGLRGTAACWGPCRGSHPCVSHAACLMHVPLACAAP